MGSQEGILKTLHIILMWLLMMTIMKSREGGVIDCIEGKNTHWIKMPTLVKAPDWLGRVIAQPAQVKGR